jgi:hypothetical protein
MKLGDLIKSKFDLQDKLKGNQDESIKQCLSDELDIINRMIYKIRPAK